MSVFPFPYLDGTALVTGASSGIGESFARALAGRGMNLILTARSDDRLRALADELRQHYRVRVDVVPLDLSQSGASDTLRAATDALGYPIDLVINNAGVGVIGPFVAQSTARLRQMVRLNVEAVTDVAALYLPALCERRAGGMVIVASTAAFQPIPYMSAYAATKAYDLQLGEGLAAECRRYGVRVVTLCPGPTATAFGGTASAGTSSAENMERMMRMAQTPEQVVVAALRALDRAQPLVVSGRLNWLGTWMTRLIPRSMVARVAERALRPH